MTGASDLIDPVSPPATTCQWFTDRTGRSHILVLPRIFLTSSYGLVMYLCASNTSKPSATMITAVGVNNKVIQQILSRGCIVEKTFLWI